MTRSLPWLLLLLLLLLPTVSMGQGRVDAAPEVRAPAVVLPGNPFTLEVSGGEGPYTLTTAGGRVLESGTLGADGGKVEGVSITSAAELPLRLQIDGGAAAEVQPRYLPGWVSIVPPLIAIVLALLFREVVVSLFAGVWLGAFLWTGFNPLTAVLRAADTFTLPEVVDEQHAAILLFSLMIGGMVGVVGRNGGTLGIVESIAPYATTPRRGLFATYVQGLAIFFDDYANTLIVGSTMRPVTDRLRVSREKLAYIVDSTSAPVASIMFVSTWVGYEISLISDGLNAAATAVQGADPALAAELGRVNAFNLFLDTIPYRFYPLLALFFVLMVIWMRRDFGPMYHAEVRARSGGGLHRPGAALLADPTSAIDPPEGAPLRWWNALIPVLVVIVGVIFGLYASGAEALGPGDYTLREIYGEANSFHVLLWASLMGSMAAILLTVVQRILTLQEAIDAWLRGLRSMVLAMVILVLAWGLGNVTEVLGTAQYISSVLQGNVTVHLLPVIVFVASAAISFATGTSWGTMAILLPLVIPLGATLAIGLAEYYTIILGVVSSVLAGSIFGDHCSPISDTTVMSSMASACDHMDHVRTQLPYALLVGVIGMAVGDVPTAYGLSPWISLLIGAVILVVVLRLFGRDTEVGPEPHLTPAEASAAAHSAVLH